MDEKDGYQIWIPNERKVVLSRDVLFKPEVVCNSRNNITRTESDKESTVSMSGGSNSSNAERRVQVLKKVCEKKQPCSEFHVTPTEEIQVLQSCKSNEESTVSQKCKSDEESTVSTFGGSIGSNAERYAQDRENVRERKQPNWMTSGEFACLADDSQGNYCLNPISYTEAMQSNEQKQRMKAMNEELALLKENETWELVNRPVNAKVIQNRWATCVKKSCNDKARFKAQPVVNGAVSWTSQLQKTTALSTTEAETIAASEGVKKPVRRKRLQPAKGPRNQCGGSACCQNVFDLKHCVVKLKLPPGSNEVTCATFLQYL
jgi:hypothetical protein